MKTALTGAAAAAALALGAAGCGGGSPPAQPVAATSQPAPQPPAASSQPAAPAARSIPAAAPASGSGDCLLAANGADVEVGIANPAQSCGQWVQNLAGSGLAWYPITAMAVPGSQAADSDTYQEACDLTANGGEELYVEDAGGMSYGNNLCSQEETNGWVPESLPGPLASAAQQDEQQEAAVSASASAESASAAQANQLVEDDARLGSDVTQAGTDYKQWSADVGTAEAAYQAVKSEPLCSGGTSDQNTYDDAQNVYDDGQSIYDDEQALSSDIAALQSDVGALAGNAQYAGDVTTAQAALSKAQGAVNADESSTIQSEASAVQTATGNCS